MNSKTLKIISVVIYLIFPVIHLSAQLRVDAGLIYSTEVETTFNKRLNWVNLLQTNFDIYFKKEVAGNYGMLKLNLITTYQTFAGEMANDLQGFSNIREKNYLFSPFLAGYSYKFMRNEAFIGLRNVNEDYFTTDYTSLFTQSSAGIHPTLSANYNLPNYPYSGLSVFIETHPIASLRLRSSIYNGTSGAAFVKAETPFRFNDEGVFFLQDVLLKNEIWNCNLGLMAQFKRGKAIRDFVIWGITEKLIYSSSKYNIGLLGEFSYAFNNTVDCSSFMSVGLVANGLIGAKDRSVCGIQFYYAGFRERSDLDLELTWRYQLKSYCAIQPAFHFMKADKWNVVGILRCIMEI